MFITPVALYQIKQAVIDFFTRKIARAVEPVVD